MTIPCDRTLDEFTYRRNHCIGSLKPPHFLMSRLSEVHSLVCYYFMFVSIIIVNCACNSFAFTVDVRQYLHKCHHPNLTSGFLVPGSILNVLLTYGRARDDVTTAHEPSIITGEEHVCDARCLDLVHHTNDCEKRVI